MTAEYAIQELRFWSGENGFNLPISNFQFQYRSGNQWVNAASDSDNLQAEFIATFEPVVTREVRLLVSQNADSSVKLYEIEVFGSLLGDVNLDGLVNLLDVDPFISLIFSGQYQAEGDINLDGQINLLDVAPFISLVTGN